VGGRVNKGGYMLHIHKWIKTDEQPKYIYLTCCKCGKRKAIELFSGGYQPMKYKASSNNPFGTERSNNIW
jgi:hypothetical protein